MIQIRRNAIVQHTCEQMFDLVNDVEAYPRRFAWCSAAQLLANGSDTLTAHLEVRVAATTQAFTTRNTMQRPHRIDIRLVEGPFRQLSGTWEFVALGEYGCRISLALDFEYSGRLMAPVMRTGFEKVADRMVDDFCNEAARAYA